MDTIAKCMDTIAKCVFGCCRSVYDDVNARQTRFDDLRRAVIQLHDKIEDTQKQINDKGATRRVMEGVEDWLKRARDLEKEARSLPTEYEERSRCLCDTAPNVLQTYLYSRKAKEKHGEVEQCIRDYTFEKVLIDLPIDDIPDDGVVVGMDSVLDEIRRYVRDDSASVIAICGMGGVGKTTILTEFFNKYQPKDNEKKISIDLAESPGIEMIQKKIINKSNVLEWKNDPKEREKYMFKEMKDGQESFLLILDNVWKPFDLKKAGIPDPQVYKKAKVILSTRSKDVCAQMNAKIVEVKCLSPEDAWNLFVQKAGEATQRRIATDSRIKKQAEKLVGKCDGLPEALINLAYAAASKETQEEWQYVNDKMDTKPWNIVDMEKVLSSLEQSYERVDEKVQKCLLYCSLYPSGFSMHKEWIMDYCIGEGIFNDYNEGAGEVRKLKDASLLETGATENQIRMHPMIRAMALWIACDKSANRWLVRPALELKEAPRARDWEGAQRISLMRNEIDTLPECPNCPELETLMLQRNRPLKKIPDDFFKSMSILKVLDLSHTAIEELPVGIARLVSLQYLDVCGTKIRSLPKELALLRKLMFLLLSYTPIKTIPDGVIAKLSQLQVFYVDFSYAGWKVVSDGTGVGIEELRKLEQLRTLGISVQNTEVLQNLASSYRLAASTRSLEITDCPRLTSISNQLSGDNLKNVETLGIRRAEDLKEVTIDGSEWYLQKVRRLTLECLPDFKLVWNGGRFENLYNLIIERCDRMESLVYWNNDEVAEEEGEIMEPIDAFPFLVNLVLIQLPDLKSLCSRGRELAFPRMRYLKVENCPNLNKLAMVADNLQKISGGELWEKAGMEWRRR